MTHPGLHPAQGCSCRSAPHLCPRLVPPTSSLVQSSALLTRLFVKRQSLSLDHRVWQHLRSLRLFGDTICVSFHFFIAFYWLGFCWRQNEGCLSCREEVCHRARWKTVTRGEGRERKAAGQESGRAESWPYGREHGMIHTHSSPVLCLSSCMFQEEPETIAVALYHSPPTEDVQTTVASTQPPVGCTQWQRCSQEQFHVRLNTDRRWVAGVLSVPHEGGLAPVLGTPNYSRAHRFSGHRFPNIRGQEGN